ncbi:uncharacterized protein N0V89_001246 [Didymosphaeria variabile]|uniref:MFS general substrate transporter n=1 Tax=Didymosphaeria variabile TaxID=1932322 RepID=A0A9W9CGG6_9PLEO|nr:uncharacterized protein N0V89_001246 [Didymosphaeria variabile]KAJ4360679.1 hypothetical protein N0V89_001246 [Didymosphaeria variabile]
MTGQQELAQQSSPEAGRLELFDDVDDIEDYPDGGGEAWTVVFGAWCAMIPSMGLLNTVGVLQAWVWTHQLRDYTEFDIGWIFGLYGFFLYVTGAQVGPIFDAHDVRLTIVPSEYYQFLLTFGVLGGLSASCQFTPAIATIGHWFSKRRALATGIACTAGGTGGIIFPLIILYAAPVIGYGWAIRIVGFICLIAGVLACWLLRKRLPHNKKAGASIDLKALKDRNYALTTLAVWLVEFAVFIPYTYISSYAIYQGVEPQHAYRLSALLNAGAIPGRALPGYVADRFGYFNVMCITSFTCATFIFALWLTSGASEAAITAFAVIFGFWSGAAISLTPVCIGQVCKTEDYGKRSGTTFSISSLAVLVSIPIAGAIVNASGGAFTGLIVFAGASYMAAFLAFLLTRIVAAGWSWRIQF